MALFVEDLGGKIFRCPANGECIIALHKHLREPEVCESYVTGIINQNVLWFEAILTLIYSR